MSTIRFSDYDALGFDMDFTLARYELVPFFNMVYDGLCKFLVEEKNYDASIFHNLHEDKDLIYKGLIVDFEKGNILKLGHNGYILRATHGTKKMSSNEIEAAYGAERMFPDYEIFKNGMKSPDQKWRFFENYFDTPGLVAFARIVDDMHQKGSEHGRPTYEHIWADVLAGLENEYIPTQFAANKGHFFPAMKSETSKYIDKVSQQFKDWLIALRQDGRKVFFLTSSYVDFATLVMETAFGPDWQSFFDVTLFSAGKPKFFTESRPFIEIKENTFEMGKPVSELEAGGRYVAGNYKVLENFITSLTGKENPKIAYFGDNLWADAWPSRTVAKWDAVLILEEMDAEGYAVTDGTVPGHDDEQEDPDLPPRKRKRRFEHSSLVTAEELEYMVSDFWESIFVDSAIPPSELSNETESREINTAFGDLISQFANICVPSIEYLSGVPVDHVFTTFTDKPGNSRGFHPGRPRSLLQSKAL